MERKYKKEMENIGRGRGNQRSRADNREVLKKVQVVYYLTRNGQLEHPHFMEVRHLPNQPLRLKDFIAKLIVLRGRGMPYQYSWSCRRSYKNGYVWNDLTEDDIIHPSQETEYILKGSEIVHYPEAETESHHQLQTERRPQTPIRTKDSRLQPKEHDYSWKTENPAFDVQEEAKVDDHHSPTCTISCEKWAKIVNRANPPSPELTPRRNSILFQLIACRRGLVVDKGKNIPCIKQQICRGEAKGGGGAGDSCRSSITVLEEARAETGDEEGQRSENGDKNTCIPSLRRKHHKESKY